MVNVPAPANVFFSMPALFRSVVTVAFVVGCVMVAAAQAPPTQELQQTHPVPASGRVFVRNVYGNVRITAWDRPEIKIVSLKRANSSANLGTAEVVVQNQQNRLCIASKYGSGRRLKEWFGVAADPCGDPPHVEGDRADLATVDYAIWLPSNVGIVVIASEGNVDIEGTAGTLYVDINRGHLNAVDIGGDCKLYGSFSGVNVTLHTLPMDTHITSAVGPLVVRVLPELNARVHARSIRKIVQNDFGWPMGSESQGTLGNGKTLLDVFSSDGRVEIRRLQPEPSTSKAATPAKKKPAKK